jgi:threonine dehydrogenase-like Zn-dependent dehydrogenase
MEYRKLGNTGLEVSILGFGASSLGGVFHQVDPEACVKTVWAALDGGINFFDVSPAYGETLAETNLGIALKGIARDGIAAGDLPTAIFDATGNGRSMASAFEYPANGGRLIFVGLFQGEVTFNDPNFHRRELTILASRNARPDDFSRIISLIEAKRIDTSPWITHRARLSDVVTEFPLWTKPETGVIKAMIEV